MPKGLEIKDRYETVHFDSHWTAGVDYHYENKMLSAENGEGIEEESDYELESDSDSESDKSSTENYD